MQVDSIFSFSHNVLQTIITNLTLSKRSPDFYMSTVEVVWKHCRKKRNCWYRAISPIPTVLSTHLDNSIFSSNLKLLPATYINLEESKICRLGKTYVTFYLLSAIAFNLGKVQIFFCLIKG